MKMHGDALEKELGSNALAARWVELEAETERLACEGRRFVEYFQLAPEPYVVTDGEGMITAANEAAGILLGVPCISRKPIVSLVAIDQRATFRSYFALVRDTPAAQCLRWRSAMRHPSGARIAVSVHVRPIERAVGPPPGYCWVIRPLEANE